MSSIEFIVEGPPVPYVRTTQKQKYADKQYRRYQAYSERVRWAYMLARSRLKSQSMAHAGRTSTTSQKASLMPLMAPPTSTISNASNLSSGVRVKIVFKEKEQ